MEQTQVVKVERKGMVAVITLDNPPLNLISMELLVGLREAVESLEKEPDVRCIVITGAGERAFCAGADVTQFKALPGGALGPFGRSVMDLLAAIPKPVIAAIDGYCLGGGLEIALACDIRMASETAKLGLTEANLGLFAGYGGVSRLPWLIGEGNAKLMLFSGDKFTAAEAKELGVLQFVYPREELMDKAMELAEKFASKGPRSIAATKEVMAVARQSVVGASLVQENITGKLIRGSYDAGEGIRALKEKRQPKFENR